MRVTPKAPDDEDHNGRFELSRAALRIHELRHPREATFVTDHHTLYLLRHAKSSWDEPLPDHERPLSSRGIRDARSAGRLLTERGWQPDLVLCSSAVRTRQTWQHALTAGGEAGEVRYLDEIYEGSLGQLLGVVRQTPEEVASLMLIGHGPGLPSLAEWLARRPEPHDAWARMDAKYPTAGLAVLRLPGGWADAGSDAAELVAFEVPRG